MDVLSMEYSNAIVVTLTIRSELKPLVVGSLNGQGTVFSGRYKSQHVCGQSSSGHHWDVVHSRILYTWLLDLPEASIKTNSIGRCVLFSIFMLERSVTIFTLSLTLTSQTRRWATCSLLGRKEYEKSPSRSTDIFRTRSHGVSSIVTPRAL